MYEKAIALLLDYDQCLTGFNYVYPYQPEVVGPPLLNTSIIDTNQALWDYVFELAAQPGLETIYLCSFSARQCPDLDSYNSFNNHNESSFLGLTKIEDYLNRKLKDRGSVVKVVLHKLLMSDLQHGQPQGSHFDLGLSLIDFSLTQKGLGRIPQSYKQEKSTVSDTCKVAMTFSLAQLVPAAKLYIFDDHLDILKSNRDFFDHPEAHCLIPWGKQLILHCYDSGEFLEDSFATHRITGTGNRIEITQAVFNGLPRALEHSIDANKHRGRYLDFFSQQSPLAIAGLFGQRLRSAENLAAASVDLSNHF